MGSKLTLVLFFAAWFGTALAVAEEGGQAAIPHLGEKGLAGYQDYMASAEHKAFVIAPGGTWAWSAEQSTPDMALDTALEECGGYTEQKCVPYAQDDSVVFDAQRWSGLWGDYANAEDAAKAKVGTKRGERFPDLRLVAADGDVVSLEKHRGHVVMLHFWGSWCPSCAHELPDLAKLRQRLQADKLDVEMLFVPVREDAAESRAWLKTKHLDLPVFDGGASDMGEESLALADGTRLSDRTLAEVFPTTYVLDKHGMVVFSLSGAPPAWEGYLPFLQDAVSHSGQ
ncbi:MAG: TlpA disulfide reductase family protein [Thiothrix sp.]|uniref:TlpA family protein disulfide reductase n=1 Tax=Thiothrix sp. TaxID=1032 RepID=UPI002636FC01|nr:TlpA disulfide reductase family protein [Thiothrix sp.]MDD5392620.1 TlpA disulfide reductase family protein [Thiothrix sp.]